ncbi:MAG: AIR synthase related protein [Thermoplasmata archaeon]
MLKEIVELVRNYEGLRRKKPISSILEELIPVENIGRTVWGFGEDCAVIDHEGSYLLLAAESIWPKLLEDPKWAGYCSILVNVNDIYAMGGRPIAAVNTLSFRDENEGRLLARGMRKGSRMFKVPIVGGHIQPESDSPSISLCILGSAKNPVSSFGCRAGDDVIAAIDLNGKMKSRFLNFDSTSGKSSKDVLFQLEAFVKIADERLASAAKDISNPGVLGSIAMLLETSKVGAEIDVGKIPKPEEVDMNDWFLAYPGCGFIVTSASTKSEEVLRILRSRNLSATIVGQATHERKMRISFDGESRVLFDLENEIITGAVSTRASGARDG